MIARPFAFYVFSLAGHVYAGTHQARARSGWRPARGERGTGALPDGYRGSGKRWLNVVRKHGVDAVRWRVVAVLTNPTRDKIDAMEQGVIAIVRRMWPSACCNLREGTVMTSADAKVIQNRLEVKAKKAAASYAQHGTAPIPFASEAVLDQLVAALRDRPARELTWKHIGRLGLEFDAVPRAQFAEACERAGIRHKNAIRIAFPRLVAKHYFEAAPAKEQTIEAFQLFWQEQTSNIGKEELAVLSVLRFPDVARTPAGVAFAAEQAGVKKGTMPAPIRWAFNAIELFESTLSTTFQEAA